MDRQDVFPKSTREVMEKITQALEAGPDPLLEIAGLEDLSL